MGNACPSSLMLRSKPLSPIPIDPSPNFAALTRFPFFSWRCPECWSPSRWILSCDNRDACTTAMAEPA
jgi:hypothetical protein